MPTSAASRRPHLMNTFSRFTLIALVILSVCVVGADAQSRKKRRQRRASKPVAARPVITNPTIAPPSTTDNGDLKILSTADQDAETEAVQPKKTKNSNRTASDQQDDMKETINTLSNQVNKLTDKLSQMQEDDRYMMDMERLTRAEQRSEQLRSQLVDVQSKMADLQSRLEQIDYSLKPENIERATMTYGTVHPEEARESRRRQLESEKARVQAQLNILETSRTRLEQAVASADTEVDLLRARLNQQRDANNSESQPDTRQTTKTRKPPQP